MHFSDTPSSKFEEYARLGFIVAVIMLRYLEEALIQAEELLDKLSADMDRKRLKHGRANIANMAEWMKR